jgi:signal transduction histidine kinase
MEAMPSGGELVVRWRDGSPGRTVVEFEDQGAGIAAEDLPRVVSRSIRPRRAVPGSDCPSPTASSNVTVAS